LDWRWKSRVKVFNLPVNGNSTGSKGRESFGASRCNAQDSTWFKLAAALQTSEPFIGPRFDAIDRDHDGTLDRKELRGIVSANEFTKGDPDKDGTLDKTEYETLVTEHFQTADSNHDGSLDQKELNSRPGRGLLRLLQ
jgi:hypothetical protein